MFQIIEGEAQGESKAKFKHFEAFVGRKIILFIERNNSYGFLIE